LWQQVLNEFRRLCLPQSRENLCEALLGRIVIRNDAGGRSNRYMNAVWVDGHYAQRMRPDSGFICDTPIFEIERVPRAPRTSLDS
jgi:prepilin-type processing-associated H-X9-DG protein